MEPQKWKFIDRKIVFKHPRLQLAEDQVELPDGNVTSYLREVPTVHDSVAIIAINANKQILLQREYSYPTSEVLWQLPGGDIEDGEDIIAAAKRELSEESDFTANTVKQLGFYYTNNRRSNQKQYVVLCTNLSHHREEGDPEEFILSVWMSFDQLQQKILTDEVHSINLLAALNLWSHYSGTS
jgi:ADP-ribose pyrophosphatase